MTTSSPPPPSSSSTTTSATTATAHALCDAAVDYVLQHVNTIQYLVHSIEQLQEQPFARTRIRCLPSRDRHHDSSSSSSSDLDATRVAAGYVWRRVRADCDKGDIVLLEDDATILQAAAQHVARHARSDRSDDADNDDAHNQGSTPRVSAHDLAQHHTALLHHVERNVRHELMHAYDDARGDVDANNCLHQACSEVRAARFSGDCLSSAELKRGRVNVLQSGLQCVRRRAALAVEQNALCRGFGERAVASVFTRCYTDYEPFAAPLFALGSYGDETYSSAALTQVLQQQQQQQQTSCGQQASS